MVPHAHQILKEKDKPTLDQKMKLRHTTTNSRALCRQLSRPLLLSTTRIHRLLSLR